MKRYGNGHGSARRPWYWNIEPNPENDLALLIKAGLDKHGNPVRRFETEDEADARREKDVEYLANGRLIGRTHLGPLLAGCLGPDGPCGSAACRVCIRQLRRAEGSLVLPFLRERMERGYKPHFLTLVFTKPYLRRSRPNYAGVLGLRATLKTMIRRAGLQHLMLIGGFEWDWDVEELVFTPHAHLVVMLKDARDIDPLRPYFERTPRARRPMVLEEIREQDLPRVLAYCLKFDPGRRIRCGENDESTKKVRPETRERYIGLHWLHSYEPTHLIFRQRLKRIGRTMIKV